MQSLYRFAVVLALLLFLSVSLLFSFKPAYAENDVHKDGVITGNLICLFPDQNSGKVKPEVLTEPCDTRPEHIHFFLDTKKNAGYVYAVEGSDDAINRLKKSTKRKNIDLKGKISGNEKAWIITVD